MQNQTRLPTTRNRAILLLGPTGTGKTPLGELIERRGLWRMRCLHFDFGANLREVVRRDRPDDLLGRQDIDFVKQVLHSGALLENERFPIAQRILQSFMAARGAGIETIEITAQMTPEQVFAHLPSSPAPDRMTR